MVLLYKDPKGETMTSTTRTHTSVNMQTKENVIQLNTNNLSRSRVNGNEDNGDAQAV